jgi:predicted XRE-type DNA-binding protein
LKVATEIDKLTFMKPVEWDLSPKSGYASRLSSSIGAWYTLHGELVDERQSKRLTQRELAAKLEITQPAVSVFENSNTLATQIGTLISYAAALGFEIEFSLKKADYPDLPER